MNFFQFASSSRQQQPAQRQFTGMAGISTTPSPASKPSLEIQRSPIKTIKSSSQNAESKESDPNESLDDVENDIKVFSIWANQQESLLSKLINDSSVLEKKIDCILQQFSLE